MPKPRVVHQTVLPPPAYRSAVAKSAAEHNFKLKVDDWEIAVFDNATQFVVSWFRGRDNHGKCSYGSRLDEALQACGADDRAVVYAAAPSGRSICLDRARWPFFLERWKKAFTSDAN